MLSPISSTVRLSTRRPLQMSVTMLMALVVMLNCGPQAATGAELSVVVRSNHHYRSTRIVPNIVEMYYNQTWIFGCTWLRRNVSEKLQPVIDTPMQPGPRNCQFGTLTSPAICTPSFVQFPTDTGNQYINLTCAETGNNLTCFIKIDSFNPRHIGAWSCKNLEDLRNETIWMQYYRNMSRANLVLASWDPIEPRNETHGASNQTEAAINRFECFTNISVIPPARLTYYLGGYELTASQTRFPVQYISSTNYTRQPNPYVTNATRQWLTTPPRGDLNMRQQLLASSRILEMRLERAYNGLILECVANQDLSEAHPVPNQGFVLHLDKHSGGGSQVASARLLLVLVAAAAAALATHQFAAIAPPDAGGGCV